VRQNTDCYSEAKLFVRKSAQLGDLNSTEFVLLQAREGNSRINGGFQQVRGILRFQM